MCEELRHRDDLTGDLVARVGSGLKHQKLDSAPAPLPLFRPLTAKPQPFENTGTS